MIEYRGYSLYDKYIMYRKYRKSVLCNIDK